MKNRECPYCHETVEPEKKEEILEEKKEIEKNDTMEEIKEPEKKRTFICSLHFSLIVCLFFQHFNFILKRCYIFSFFVVFIS